MKKPITCLQQIPVALFYRFSKAGTIEPRIGFRQGKCRHSIAVARGKVLFGNEPLTFVNENCLIAPGIYEWSELRVYRCAVKAPHFIHCEKNAVPDPLLTICFYSDDVPFGPKSKDAIRDKTKGYWIGENLGVAYGGAPHLTASITPEFIGDEEVFGELVKIQDSAFRLMSQVHVRGHWQVQWCSKNKKTRKT